MTNPENAHPTHRRYFTCPRCARLGLYLEKGQNGEVTGRCEYCPYEYRQARPQS
jgi:hypothetical protein